MISDLSILIFDLSFQKVDEKEKKKGGKKGEKRKEVDEEEEEQEEAEFERLHRGEYGRGRVTV